MFVAVVVAAIQWCLFVHVDREREHPQQNGDGFRKPKIKFLNNEHNQICSKEEKKLKQMEVPGCLSHAVIPYIQTLN